MVYKALGYAVWNGVKWYLTRKMPSRKIFVAGGLGLVLATVAAAGAKREIS